MTEQPAAPYLDAVIGYGTRGPGRFHVPGHKGGQGADPGLRFGLGDPRCGSTSRRTSGASTSDRRRRPTRRPSASPPRRTAPRARGS